LPHGWQPLFGLVCLYFSISFFPDRAPNFSPSHGYYLLVRFSLLALSRCPQNVGLGTLFSLLRIKLDLLLRSDQFQVLLVLFPEENAVGAPPHDLLFCLGLFLKSKQQSFFLRDMLVLRTRPFRIAVVTIISKGYKGILVFFIYPPAKNFPMLGRVLGFLSFTFSGLSSCHPLFFS